MDLSVGDRPSLRHSFVSQNISVDVRGGTLTAPEDHVHDAISLSPSVVSVRRWTIRGVVAIAWRGRTLRG
jgi:hypothetical protein